jgi:predicted phage tail protein
MQDIIGFGGGGGKGGGGSARTPVESPDSLRSKAIARVLDLVSEGEVEGLVNGLQSVYLDETPIQNADGSYNFNGVTIETRNGTQSQEYISGFPSVENEVSVDVEIKVTQPVVRSISNPSVNAVRVRIMIPQLTYQNPSNGDLSGTSVQYAIDTQPNGGAWTEVVNQTINGKTTSRYERQHRVELTGTSPWNIRIRRITADSTNANLQNKTYLASYTEIVDAKLRYPNSALVALTVDSAQFNSIPRRGYLMKLLRIKVPTNYDPVARTYTGIWDGSFKIAWSDNPAWCFYDLLTNARYGLGDYLDTSQIDKWSLYKISQYCDGQVPDGFGGYEPRFTCNLYLQTRAEAYNVLQDMASIFRGMLYWQQGSITAVQDAPEDAVYLYTNANVIDGLFTYSGSSRKARHTVALVTWNDPDDNYKAKVEYVEDVEGIKRFGVVQTEVTAVGCTSRGQANRVGKWILYSERMETEILEFKTGLDGVVARPGQIIKVANQDKAGARIGGRLSAVASPSSFTLDAPITMDNGATYFLSLITPDGKVEEQQLISSSGTFSVVTASTAFSFTPTTQTIWVMRSSVLEPEYFRVLSVAESDNNTYAITAMAHEPSKFDAIENDLQLESRTTSILSSVPGEITTVNVSEYLYIAQGDVRTMMTVSWVAPTQAARYSVEYRKTNGGNWVVLPDTMSTSLDIQDVQVDSYQVRIRAISVVGLYGVYSDTVTYSVLGKTAPPADVTGFTNVVEQFGISLKWNKNADIDLDAYEIRYGGASWDTSTFLEKAYTTSYNWQIKTAGTYRVWIKAIDTTGNYSTNAVITDISIGVPAQSNLTARISGPNIVLEWTSVVGAFSIDHYEVRQGSTWSSGTDIAAPMSNTLQFVADFGGSRTFWVAGVDVAGNVGTPTSVTVQIQSPSVAGATAEVIDNNVLLRWQDGTASLPIDYYSVSKGAVFESATEVGIIYSRFAALFEQAGGTYTYWIVPVDSAGNIGTPASVSAVVSQPPDYVLQYDQNSTLNGTRSNVQLVEGALLAVLPDETWQQHFANRSWATIQAQIDAGDPLYFQPSTTSGTYDETIDYGALVTQGTTISVTPTYNIIRGSVTFTIDLFVKANIQDAWIQFTGQSSIYATNFRYVRFRINFTSGSGSDNLIQVTSISTKMAVKLRNDNGSGYAVSTDVGGTVVNFTPGTFIDVNSINVTAAVPAGGQPIIALYDFVDIPNPTSFKVLLYDLNGNRVSGSFSWSAKGV